MWSALWIARYTSLYMILLTELAGGGGRSNYAFSTTERLDGALYIECLEHTWMRIYRP
jgi:hypothetical protein